MFRIWFTGLKTGRLDITLLDSTLVTAVELGVPVFSINICSADEKGSALFSKFQQKNWTVPKSIAVSPLKRRISRLPRKYAYESPNHLNS